MTTLSLELPEKIFFLLRKAPQRFLKDMRLAAAIQWCAMGELSEQQAAEIAGISDSELLQAIQHYQERVEAKAKRLAAMVSGTAQPEA